MLADVQSRLPGPPSFGLYVDAVTRGPELYGLDGLDSALVCNAFPGIPILGWQARTQIVQLPVGLVAQHHAGALAVFGA
jgi:small ligand-binding sensory domain FIST